jgi:ribose/xylose/arabinose/galactoside ABC-type transport system permease subunit
VDEVVATLMVNFAIFYAMMALLDGPWKDPLSGSPDIRFAAEFPTLPGASRLHLGVLLAALAALGIWFLMTRATLGFQIRAVGSNPRAATHAGISVGRMMLLAAAISGALARPFARRRLCRNRGRHAGRAAPTRPRAFGAVLCGRRERGRDHVAADRRAGIPR